MWNNPLFLFVLSSGFLILQRRDFNFSIRHMSEFNELSKCVPRIFLYTFPSKLLIVYLISKCADYLSCVWNWSREKKVKINMTARRIQLIIWFMINWSLIDFFRLLAELLALNTTSGPFRKLGRLYESCLRQAMNSSTIRLLVEKLGGYLPLNSLGPKSIANLVTKINEIGPNPLIDIYYDLSYGRKPRVLLIIDGPIDPSHLLEVSDFVWQFSWILAHNSFLFSEPRSMANTKISPIPRRWRCTSITRRITKIFFAIRIKCRAEGIRKEGRITIHKGAESNKKARYLQRLC